MDYIVFDTEDAASVAEQIIFGFGADIASQLGYTVDEVGIAGRRQGESSPNTAHTTHWDVPWQRLTDGKWVVLHPKYHPTAEDPDSLAALEALLGDIVVDAASSDWRPSEDD